MKPIQMGEQFKLWNEVEWCDRATALKIFATLPLRRYSVWIGLFNRAALFWEAKFRGMWESPEEIDDTMRQMNFENELN